MDEIPKPQSVSQADWDAAYKHLLYLICFREEYSDSTYAQLSFAARYSAHLKFTGGPPDARFVLPRDDFLLPDGHMAYNLVDGYRARRLPKPVRFTSWPRLPQSSASRENVSTAPNAPQPQTSVSVTPQTGSSSGGRAGQTPASLPTSSVPPQVPSGVRTVGLGEQTSALAHRPSLTGRQSQTPALVPPQTGSSSSDRAGQTPVSAPSSSATLPPGGRSGGRVGQTSTSTPPSTSSGQLSSSIYNPNRQEATQQSQHGASSSRGSRGSRGKGKGKGRESVPVAESAQTATPYRDAVSQPAAAREELTTVIYHIPAGAYIYVDTSVIRDRHRREPRWSAEYWPTSEGDIKAKAVGPQNFQTFVEEVIHAGIDKWRSQPVVKQQEDMTSEKATHIKWFKSSQELERKGLAHRQKVPAAKDARASASASASAAGSGSTPAPATGSDSTPAPAATSTHRGRQAHRDRAPPTGARARNFVEGVAAGDAALLEQQRKAAEEARLAPASGPIFKDTFIEVKVSEDNARTSSSKKSTKVLSDPAAKSSSSSSNPNPNRFAPLATEEHEDKPQGSEATDVPREWSEREDADISQEEVDDYAAQTQAHLAEMKKKQGKE